MAMGMPCESSSALLLSTATHWLDFLPARSVGTCCSVCAGMQQAAGEDRLWKDLCHQRWRRVNVHADSGRRGGDGGAGGHKAAYGSLNGWRDPRGRLTRTIFSTTPRSASGVQRVTRAATAAASGGGHATNISGMDVSSSRVVVCSADTAWYIRVPRASDALHQQHTHERRECRSRSQSQQRRIHPARDDDAGTASGREGNGTDCAESTLESSSEEAAARAAADVPPECVVPGFRLPSSCVTEARFSEDEERCFFGSMSGEVYVHECSNGSGTGHSLSGADGSPILALTSPGGSPVAVRQVVATFDGGCSRGSRLGVLCRPPSGWQPNPEGSGGGYLFLVDSHAQEVARWMKLGGEGLGGVKFPNMARGGAAVSTAPLSSEGMPFGGAGGQLFAVGFAGGSVALYDARCQASGGMVAGFVTRHRWLERMRSAGPLLMASYGRSKNIETWDIRNLPTCPTGEGSPPAVPTPGPPAPPLLGDLACAASSPDFWVEPHGLCVAVYGAPRHSQRFGAKHAFWPWPNPAVDPFATQTSSSSSSSSSAGASEGGAELSGDPTETGTPALGKGEGGHAGGGSGGRGGRGGGVRGVEVSVPGVVSDSGYRLCLSTGIKFTDTHLATVLDSCRVLVDEMMVLGEPAEDVDGIKTVLLTS
eukprot:g10614.t2